MVRMTHKDINLRPKIALYEPDIPQNTASIIRTCACLGAYVEIIEPCGFLLTDKRFKRVVMDYMNYENLRIYKSENEFFKHKKNERVILMTTKAKKLYTEFVFKKNDTILFGRESSGVPEKVHNKISLKLKIPMIKKYRSLNLSTSVSILLSENLRQTKYLNGFTS
tara:strand:+ start:67 stop:564 length:498 start_codon:yes stop_codon:yes gene_type:complete